MDDRNQFLGNTPAKTKLLTSTLNTFDINLLPARYQPKRIRLVGVLPWLLLLVLIAAIYPSSIVAQEAQADYKAINAEVAILQSSLESYQSAADELSALQDQIDLAAERRDLILASYQGIDLQGSNWSSILGIVVNNVPENITWTTINQQDREIILEGVSGTYQSVLDLQSTLSGLGLFSAVRIDTIDQIVLDPAEIRVEVDADGQVLPTPPPPYNFIVIVSLTGEGQ